MQREIDRFAFVWRDARMVRGSVMLSKHRDSLIKMHRLKEIAMNLFGKYVDFNPRFLIVKYQTRKLTII